MRIEYLDGPGEYLPLIRLFHFKTSEIAELRQVVDRLAAGGITEFNVARLAFANVVGGIRFAFRLTDRDDGIKETSPMNFELRYTKDGWEDLSARFETFKQPTNGYQWLLDVPSDVQLLISLDGTW